MKTYMAILLIMDCERDKSIQTRVMFKAENRDMALLIKRSMERQDTQFITQCDGITEITPEDDPIEMLGKKEQDDG